MFSPEAAREILNPTVATTISILTVVLPVLAVGVLSWSAAMDYAARVNIFREMEQWLGQQAERIERTHSEHEFKRLVTSTEHRLLSETAEAGEPRGSLLRAYLREWRGPQLSAEHVENRYAGQVIK